MVRDLKKSDLKTGDVVVTKGGWQGVVLLDTASGDLIKWFKDSSGTIIQKHRKLSYVNNDLTYDNTAIVKVYRCTDPGLLTSCDVVKPEYLYWSAAKEMTIQEIEAILGFRVKLVQ